MDLTNVRPQRRARFRQVYPTENEHEEHGPGTDIDIIAIHGLDTDSEKTWTWGDRRDPTSEFNWLEHPQMLPSKVERVRIFTCDWPADLVQQSSLPTTLDECAQSLRNSILQHLEANSRRRVLFIVSCLGGIILMKALEIDSRHAGDTTDYPSLTRATCGVVFLATPFRSTAFKNMPAFLLKALSFLQDQTVTALIDYALAPSPDLDELTKGFITLTKNHGYNVFMFWEARNTILLRKFHLAWIVSPWIWTAWPVTLASAWVLDSALLWQVLVFFLLWLAVFLSCQPQLLVDKHSATSSDFDSQRLNRSHVMMNKFTFRNAGGSKKSSTESEDFGLVSAKIVEMLEKIREGSLLQKADQCIRAEHYSANRLQIERLSGDLLPLEVCFINLAIVEQADGNSQRAEGGSEEKPSSHTSPFTLSARLRVETPGKDIQVQLSSLFDPRIDSDGRLFTPRRILIRGRAGVGKTTLCKKMVAEFIRPSEDFGNWKKLFDRVLWVPLRRLKEWSPPPSNLEELFVRMYFNQKDRKRGTTLAQELQHVVERGRTLFIFDGLDDIAGFWNSDHYMLDFIAELLQQPNVIITSRPHVSLPANARPPDLELETVGFYPDQVGAYLQTTFTESKKIEHVQSYLQAHPLIQGLVRIPIQLDALCYTWENFSSEAVPQTMTAIYNAIEENLWKKDILRLGKRVNGELVTKNNIKFERMEQIENLVDSEVLLLQGLAFTGFYNDIINFELKHREAISKEFKLPNKIIYWDKTLPHLSFLRTSDPSSKDTDDRPDYHFLHLTFQEYFAARYFVRQWKAKQPVKCLQLSKGECNQIEPAALLQQHRYDPRYDIFWRFVAGLLDTDSEALSFFQEIEKEPRDLLGPVHQRLVMHCLSEVEGKNATFAGFRTKLEKQLEQWLLFEHHLTGSCMSVRDMECPEQVLVNVLKQAPEVARLALLKGLDKRAAVPSAVIDVAVPWLEDCGSRRLCVAILRLLRRQHKTLQGTLLQGIAARLQDGDSQVRLTANLARQGQANITEEMVQIIAAGFKNDEDPSVPYTAFRAIRERRRHHQGRDTRLYCR